MRIFLPVFFVALSSMASSVYGYGLMDLLGKPRGYGRGCGCEAECYCQPPCGNRCGHGCGCERDCGCEPGCACDASCACEPGCGCGHGCGDGRNYAGQKWNCCCGVNGPPICPCTGPDGSCRNGCSCGQMGCGDCCEPACGCGDCCEPACGCGETCEPGCGCGDPCGHECNCEGRPCCLKNCGFCTTCGHLLGALTSCCACSGCSSEVYWSEWHNDPPRCCDPCDCHGNWIGPSSGYRAPYDHAYSPHAATGEVYAEANTPNRQHVARQSTPTRIRVAQRDGTMLKTY
jgi:hypothetical protein